MSFQFLNSRGNIIHDPRDSENDSLEINRNKKLKLDNVFDSLNNIYTKSFKSNESILIVFYDQNSIIYSTHPTFTHQLFEDETINITKNWNEKSMNSTILIKVHIRCSDLFHIFEFSSVLDKNDIAEFKQQLEKVIPEKHSILQSNFTTSKMNSSVFPENCLEFKSRNLITSFESGNDSFEIYLSTAKDKGSAKLMHTCEQIAMWLIETADFIDFFDDRWEVLYLFKVVDKIRYIVGYTTLFNFRNPFSGSKLRICQSVIFPPFQRNKLGQKLTTCVYKLALKRLDVVEVTVEDPCLGFCRMRDLTDIQWFFDNFVLKKSPNGDLLTSALNSISDSDIKRVSEHLKLTKLQTYFIQEALLYYELLSKHKNIRKESDKNHEKYQDFRLRIKRRLMKTNDDIKSITNKESKINALDEYFKDEEVRFENSFKLIHGLVQ